jgi:drug/metabolite transporter (DMT)-like permease
MSLQSQRHCPIIFTDRAYDHRPQGFEFVKDHRPLLGISIMVASMALFSVKDGIAKTLILDIHPAQMIWMQYGSTFVAFALLTMPRHGWQAFLPTPFLTQFWRGLSAVAGVGMFYWALAFIPLAEVAAMALTAPLVVTALSPFMLNEHIGVRRIIAVVIGFIGVLVILRPGFGSDVQGLIIAFFSGILFGFNFIGNRLVAHHHPPFLNIAYNVLAGTILLTPAMPFVWSDIPAEKYSTLAGFLVLALLGHGLMVVAFKYAAASVVAPYQYTMIIFASLVGYVIFGDFPGTVTWVGIALIIGSGIFIAVREDRLKKPKP